MKPFNLLLIIAVFISLPSMAQYKVKRHYIMLSVYDNYSLIPHSTKNVLITREGGWNIASCNTIPIPNGGSALSDYLTRYILYKDEQE